MLQQKTILSVGDGSCGKSYLYLAYAKDEFSHFYVPTVYDCFRADTEVDSTPVELVLVDTGGDENYHNIRSMLYKNYQPDVVLICFSVQSRFSLINVEERWIIEVRRHFPKVPVILVANQTDLREDPFTIARLRRHRQELVTYKEGLRMAKNIKAVHYIECSAKTKHNVDHVFETAADLSFGKATKCKVM